MVQPYGAAAANTDGGYEGPDVREGESSALLGGDRDTTVKRVAKPDGHASVVSSISNLANTIIGSGMLTFPLVREKYFGCCPRKLMDLSPNALM
ncbi:hypothetical protein AAF712_007857 [Marasmius tenuissimus]|uniref:Amino acid transporter transmembrane domain-containing protein n=1 Tax=Marasmius tenuissimus TaxID=585030 RepID=A0ABR2ZY18_9AGAR